MAMIQQGNTISLEGEAIFVSFSKTWRQYKSICAIALEDYNLTPNEIEIIYFLAKQKDLNTAKDIFEYLGISKSLVCRSADALVKKGFIITEKDRQDRRVVHMILQPTANDLVRKLRKSTRDFFQKAFEGIDENEKMMLNMILEKIENNIL